MPHINPEKCYKQQPQRLAINVPEVLPADWLLAFYELLAMQLHLDDKNSVFSDFDYAANQDVMLTAKGRFFKELNRHVGQRSTYTNKANLLESLTKLYAVFTHPDATHEQRNFIARGIAEDVQECTPGFHDRVNFIIIRLNMPQNLDELLAQVRFNLVDKIGHQLADKNTQGVHVHTRTNHIANAAGFGVWAINKQDIHERTGSSDMSNEAILQKLKEGFNRHFQCIGIINALCEEIKALSAPLGYNGKREPGQEYKNGEDDKFFECLSPFISINKEIAFEKNDGKVSDIDWQNVKTVFLQKLKDEGYVMLSEEEASLLEGLLQNKDAELGINHIYQLIPDAYELAECLQFFSQWSNEQKANFVLAYLQTKSFHEQKEILAILSNEVPQLTKELKAHVGLQAVYFDIAIADKDIVAVRAYIEKGADINAALLVLFSGEHKRDTLYWLHEHPTLLQKLTVTGMDTVILQGKYQGKTIAETLISTKKGRQLVSERPDLQALLSKTSIANTLDKVLKQANDEKSTWNTALGFFKKNTPQAIQLVQLIVYGDLKQSESLLKANPELLRTLLTEEVTVKDYSRRKVKHKTAFQAALCAMDDELCAMLAQYMTEEEIRTQYQAIFPQGHQAYDEAQTAFDFHAIVHAISNSNDSDIEKALSLELPNNTALWKALEQFRAAFTKHAYQETVFNPQHLIQAFDLYDNNYNNWTQNQRNLFWRQVVGYVQRFLPANIAMDFAQGLYARVEEKEKSKRSFNFTYGGGSIFPLDFDSFSGLGFNWACGAWGVDAWLGPCAGWAVSLVFQNLCQTKTAILGELCNQGRAADSRHGV